jgi:hypothetical protein
MSLQKRVEKYRDKLFTFLEHDGVAWNNNNAEHAMKCFARYRRFADGRMTRKSVQDYLVILSIWQTCEYQGRSFLAELIGEGETQALMMRFRVALGWERCIASHFAFACKACARHRRSRRWQWGRKRTARSDTM